MQIKAEEKAEEKREKAMAKDMMNIVKVCAPRCVG